MSMKGGKYLTPEDKQALKREQAAREKKARRNAPADAEWAPVRERPSDVQRLARAVKGAAPYVAASVCLFCWELNGQIDSDTAMPALVLCALMVGGVFSKHMAGK